jgi:outer membrane protein TolC
MRNILTSWVILFLSFIFTFYSKAQSLQSYIQEAEMNNPAIQAFDLNYKILQEKVNEVNWLPNTEFSAGYFVSEPETRTGAQRAKFSTKQMLPWFGTINARKNYASSMAETDFIETIIIRRKLALSITQSYYRLYEIKAKQSILEDNIRVLETYEQLALTSIEVGNASAVDVLQLQIRKNEIQQQKEMLEQALIAERIAFNKKLNRDGNHKIQIPDSIVIPMQETLYSDSLLMVNPELIKYDKLFESVTKLEALNQKNSKPMIGFGLDYIPISERPAMDFSDNGKDILMPMISVSIPIFNNRHKSISKQHEFRQQEIQLQKKERMNSLETALASTIAKQNQAKISYKTQEANLKQANSAMEILIKGYETGAVNFNNLLDIQELQLKFRLNKIKATKEYYTQSAILNYLIQ